MQPPEYVDPIVNLLFAGKCEREGELRSFWFRKHHEEMVTKHACFVKDPKNYTSTDINYIALRKQMGYVTESFVEAACNKKKTPICDGRIIGIEQIKEDQIISKLGLGDSKDDPKLRRPKTDTSYDPIMRPVDPKLEEIFYDINKKGRKEYLNKRSLDGCPEKRYYFPESSNWDYGWRLNDSKQKQEKRYNRVEYLSRFGNHTRLGPELVENRLQCHQRC